MADLNQILKLGDPRLHQKCAPLEKGELDQALEKARTMAELIAAFRHQYGAGRAMAAPQIGYLKRLIVLNMERPQLLINPVITDKSNEMMELWDDCMSFPNLLVRVKRHQTCRIHYLDEKWQPQACFLEGSMSELLQHEYDHLDGILATQRAIDERSLALSGHLP